MPDMLRGSMPFPPRYASWLTAALLSAWAPGVCGQSDRGVVARRDVADQSVAAGVLPTFEAAGGSRQGAVSAGENGSAVRGEEFGEQQIIQRRAHVEPWSAQAGVDVFHTDNAALTDADPQKDWYLRTGAALGYTNRIKGPFFVDFSLEQDFFRYSRFDVLDFDLTRFQGTLSMQTPWHTDAFLFARYRLERLTEPGFGTALLTEHSAEVGLLKVWKISRGQQLFGGVSADLALSTSPSGGKRNEYAASLGYSLRLTERLSAALSYRGAWYEYTEGGRSDWNHIFAAGITYDLAEWLRLGINFAYTLNDSNATLADYRSATAGASIGLRLAF